MPARTSGGERLIGRGRDVNHTHDASSSSSSASSNSSSAVDDLSYHIFYGLRASPFAKTNDGTSWAIPPLAVEEEKHKVAYLETCQRFEIIAIEPTEEVVEYLQKTAEFKHLVGWRNVLDRLTLIGCGLDSELVGEASIEEQLRNSHDRLHDDNRVKSFLATALQRVTFYRQQNKILNLELQPEDIALKLLASKRKTAKPQKTQILHHLVIIGSGMMSQILARKAVNLYEYAKVLIITRHPKSVADKFESLGERVDVVKIVNVDKTSIQPMQCIIASSNLSDDYEEAVRQLIQSSSAVCDMSSTSLLEDLPEDTFQFSLNSAIFREHLHEQNKTLNEVASDLKEAIIDEPEEEVIEEK